MAILSSRSVRKHLRSYLEEQGRERAQISKRFFARVLMKAQIAVEELVEKEVDALPATIKRLRVDVKTRIAMRRQGRPRKMAEHPTLPLV